MAVAKGKLTIIAHVACNNTKDSMELARHAESLGVDAIATIPPIYFRLPEYSVAKYWNDISSAAPNTDYVIYNIPQLAGVALTPSLYTEMLKNPRVIGVMSDLKKYEGVIPAFYACYDEQGEVSPERTRA
ncbi:N-acetylneuraminate lyase [Streptococcus pneumoniae]|nr:N-acetylneuraminate lyase [Streptococcus pneumoniae]CNZ24761.1 N-acetylneuraminate lyase [Streptococcus pneumoniae]COJ79546.1 N-acetylneuraminate lyase [Streptococcus pneumoniae]